MIEHQLKVQKTARYYTYGEDITRAERVWFVLHGYGQLAKYFIKSFEPLDPSVNFVIAPEGFHRFYLEGFSGRVGASWMTKEARLDDISDYVAFLDRIHRLFDIPPDSERVLFGFSQGVATATRWITMGRNAGFDRLVLWAGSFPPDLEPENAKNALGALPVHCAIGSKDPFINEEQLEQTKQHLKSLNVEPRWFSYHGDHRIPRKALNELIATF
jgi:predicted esterase